MSWLSRATDWVGDKASDAADWVGDKAAAIDPTSTKTKIGGWIASSKVGAGAQELFKRGLATGTAGATGGASILFSKYTGVAPVLGNDRVLIQGGADLVKVGAGFAAGGPVGAAVAAGGAAVQVFASAQPSKPMAPSQPAGAFADSGTVGIPSGEGPAYVLNEDGTTTPTGPGAPGVPGGAIPGVPKDPLPLLVGGAIVAKILLM